MNAFRGHDLRLILAAALWWLAAALGEWGAVAALWTLASVCAVAAIACGSWRRWAAHPCRAASRVVVERGVLGVLAASFVVGAIASGVGIHRVTERETTLLAQAARSDGFVRVEGVVHGRPRATSGAPGTVVVQVEAYQVTWRSRVDDSPVDLVVIGDRDVWAGALPGTPVSLSGRAHAPESGSSVVALVIDSGTAQVSAQAPRWSVYAEGVRDALQEAAAVNDADTAGILVAIVDGDTSGISPVAQQEFKHSGLAHLLAVSGANVAIVLGALLWLTRLARSPFGLQVGSAAVGLVAFVAVAGPEPSVLRAAGMGVVLLVALASGRPRAAIPALCAAIIVLTAWLPTLSVSVGFVLSVLATAGIVTLGAWWTTAWSEHMPRLLAASFAVACSAAIVTLPVVVLLLPQVNVASVLANLAAAPAVPPATILGVLAAVTGTFAMPVAQLFAYFAGFFIRWIESVATWSADPGPIQIPLPAGVLAAFIVVVAVLVGWLLLRVTAGRPLWRSATAGLALGALVLSVPVRYSLRAWPNDAWIFAACDVGQGDAMLARTGDNAAIVLDTGPDPALLDQCLRDLDISTVAAVVLTHFHDDHVAGIPAVLGRRDVGEVLTGTFDGGAVETSIRRLAETSGVPVREVGEGFAADFGPVHLEVVGPIAPIIGTSSDPNNNSLIIRVTVAGRVLLITGDAQVEQEGAMLACGCLKADVLKVPHHGSKNRDDDFFAATDASLALISVGRDNDYGHPAPSTVTALRELGMTVVRTDLNGTILVSISDGQLAVTTKSA